MKKVLLLIAASLFTSVSMAQFAVTNSLTNASVKALPVIRNQLGTGTPASMDTIGAEGAAYIDDGYYHTPQYMSFFPTAATIWPRVVEVDCEKAPLIPAGIICKGYHWAPEMGRGEYLFVMPRLKAPAPVIPPTVVYVEVPVMKKHE